MRKAYCSRSQSLGGRGRAFGHSGTGNSTDNSRHGQARQMTDSLTWVFNVATVAALFVIVLQLSFIAALFAIDLFLKLEEKANN